MKNLTNKGITLSFCPNFWLFKLATKKYTCHLGHKPLVEMDMFINKDKQCRSIRKLGN